MTDKGKELGKKEVFDPTHKGLNLREHFAGLAMQGMAQNYRIYSDEVTEPAYRIAALSVKLADALCEKLSEER